MAASTVYDLEAELSDLEECARGICSSTSDMELSFLEEQVASAAAKVQQSELRVGPRGLPSLVSISKAKGSYEKALIMYFYMTDAYTLQSHSYSWI